MIQTPTLLRTHKRTRATLLTLLLVLANLILPVMSPAALAQTDVPADTAVPAEPTVGGKLMLPIVNRNACGTMRDPSMPIGLQMYGNTGRTSPYFDALNNSGAHWLRVNIRWELIEPEDVTPRQYNWSSADAALSAARDACINVIAEIEGTPVWAAVEPGAEPIRSDKLDRFAEFVAAVVQRYDGSGTSRIRVNYVELFNEPDRRFSWGYYGARYAAMLKKVYPAVKAANPATQVVFGGIAYDAFVKDGGIFVEEFMENVLKEGAGPYFDYMNFHCYPYAHSCRSRAERNSSGMMEKAAAIRAMMQKYGLDKPLMITETGWHSEKDGDSKVDVSNDELQARKLVQLLAQSMAIEADAIIWWMLFDPRPSYPFDSGLVTRGNPPALKPAYAVYRTFIRRLGWAQYLSTVSPANAASDVEAYRFRDRLTNKIVVVAWLNPVDDLTSNVTKPLQVTGKTATVYNKAGVVATVKQDADDGTTDNRVTVQVGGSPIYIVID